MATRSVKPVAVKSQQKLMLSHIFPGEGNAGIRAALIGTGVYKTDTREVRMQLRPVGNDHEVVAIAAVARDPGNSQEYLDSIKDYAVSGKSRSLQVDAYWRIYKNEGLINNAVNKIAAVMSVGGSFKVKRAKKGKARKATETLMQVLDYWETNVNQAAEDAVVTGARGLKAITHYAVRQALVEGSWVGREVWTNTKIGTLGSFDLPMNIHGMTTAYVVPDPDLALLGIDQLYWKPPQELIAKLKKPPTPEAGRLLKKLVPNKVITELNKTGQYALDPALTMHIRNRGNESDSFGESMIHAALQSIAYRRAIDQLDIVSMQNLINRLTVVMVGSADPKSPYSKPEVAAARASLMQTFFDEPGPNMTIVWQGDDVKIEDVGAYSSVLELDGRHKIAQDKIKSALGVPDALLSGTTTDGKSSGWAAMIGSSAEMEELQNSFVQAYTQLGQRIALENGFTDIDLVYEFSRNVSPDKNEERNQTRQDYVAGLVSIHSALEAQGKDPDAEFETRAIERGLDPTNESLTWEEVFMPPQGLQGQGADGQQGNGGAGRTPDSQNPKKTAPTTKPAPKKAPTPTENK